MYRTFISLIAFSIFLCLGINEEFRIDSTVPSPFKPRFPKFMTGSFRLRIGIISVEGIISVLIGGHFGGGDHFDGGDHFGGGTKLNTS